MSRLESVSLVAVILRMLLCGMSSKSASPRTSAGAASAGAALVVASTAEAASTSAAMTLPPGPVPDSDPTSTPFASARRRARGLAGAAPPDRPGAGEAARVSPEDAAAGGGGGAATGGEVAASGASEGGLGDVELGWASAGAAVAGGAKSLKAGTSAASSTMTTTGWRRGTEGERRKVIQKWGRGVPPEPGGTNRANGDVGSALRHEELGDDPVVLHFKVDRCLIGFHFGNGIARSHSLSFFLQPARDVPHGHRWRQGGHV